MTSFPTLLQFIFILHYLLDGVTITFQKVLKVVEQEKVSDILELDGHLKSVGDELEIS